MSKLNLPNTYVTLCLLRLFFVFILFVMYSTLSPTLAASRDNGCMKIKDGYHQDKDFFHGCSQIYFTAAEEIIVNSRGNSILFRNNQEQKLSVAPLLLASPHSILFNQMDELYYVCDTENNRILAFSSLKEGVVKKEIRSIAGVRLRRPHDLVSDSGSGLMYSLNPSEPVVLRFDHNGGNKRLLDLSEELGYSRSLSLIGGNLYVVGSSSGKIIEVIDFDKGTYRVYSSPGKKGGNFVGNWNENGLIRNDIEFLHVYW